MNEAFVYRWRCQRTRKWYIGYHKGTATDGYICSSRLALQAIQSEPQVWKRKILRWGTKQQMTDLERRLLRALKARTNPLSLNQHNGNGHTSTGRKLGTQNQHPDLHHTQLKKKSAQELVDLLLTETDPNRRLKLHQFLFAKVVA